MASEDVLTASTTTGAAASSTETTSTAAPAVANGPRPNPSAVPAAAAPQARQHFSRHPRIQADARKLFVGGIQRQTNQESFKVFFEEYGPVEEAFLIGDKVNPAMHRGFGFITFKDQATTDRVVSEGSNGKLLLHGASVDFRIAVPPQLKPPHPLQGTTKLFCGGCPKENFTSEELTEYMKRFGDVVESWVSPKGFGFVTFKDINGCNKALIYGINSEHNVKGHKLDVKWPRVKNNMMYGAGPRPNRFNPYNQYRQPFPQPQAGYYPGPQQYGQHQQYMYAPQPGYQQQPQQQMYGYGQQMAPAAAAQAQAPKQPTVAAAQSIGPAPQAGAAAKQGYGQAYVANRGGQQAQNRYAPY